MVTRGTTRVAIGLDDHTHHLMKDADHDARTGM